ncbi:MAG: hypothetical protein PVF54_09360 [Anaerolineae bacterium]
MKPQIWIENHCDGSGPHTGHVVRLLPVPGVGNLILCKACFAKEMEYRRHWQIQGRIKVFEDCEFYAREDEL